MVSCQKFVDELVADLKLRHVVAQLSLLHNIVIGKRQMTHTV